MLTRWGCAWGQKHGPSMRGCDGLFLSVLSCRLIHHGIICIALPNGFAHHVPCPIKALANRPGHLWAPLKSTFSESSDMCPAYLWARPEAELWIWRCPCPSGNKIVGRQLCLPQNVAHHTKERKGHWEDSWSQGVLYFRMEDKISLKKIPQLALSVSSGSSASTFTTAQGYVQP